MQLYGERKEGKKSRGRRRNIFYDRTAVRLNERGEGNAANKRERTRNGTGGGGWAEKRERERKEGKDGEKIGRFCNRCMHDTFRMPGQGNKRTLTNTNRAVAR